MLSRICGRSKEKARCAFIEIRQSRLGTTRPLSTTSGKLDWFEGFGMPLAFSGQRFSLEAEADIIVRSRWSSSCTGVGLVASGKLRKQATLWERDLILIEDQLSTVESLAKTRLTYQLFIELGDYNAAIEFIARTGLTSSNKASEPAHIGAAFGMTAFAFQQLNQLQLAEEVSSRALGIDASDMWALLALLETYQQQGRAREGLRVLRDTEQEWDVSPLKLLFLGRQAFFYFELADQSQCLRCIDLIHSGLKSSGDQPGPFQHWSKADVAALSYLLMESERLFSEHGELSDPLLKSEIDWFGARSNMPALDALSLGLMRIACGWSLRPVDFDAFAIDSSSNTTSTSTDEESLIFRSFNEKSDIAVTAQTVGRRLLVALERASSTKLTRKNIMAIIQSKPLIAQLGGLASVRDALDLGVFLTTLRWAKQSNDPEAFRLARALSLERLAKKSASGQSWFWHSQLLSYMGDFNAAHNAKTRAVDLGLGQGGSFS